MAMIIHTDNPSELLKNIRDKILKGESREWNIDAEGDFTQVSLEHGQKAWLHVINNDSNSNLTLGILGRKDEKMTKGIYSTYHCKFAEFILNSFDTDIRMIEISSMPTSYDSI